MIENVFVIAPRSVCILLDHETSSSHILAFKNWKEFEIRIKSESTIDKIERGFLFSHVS